jgi:3-hydroxyisobutyrate dehydrogenase
VVTEVLRCSAKGCRTPATWALSWNNPKLHRPDRRKTWLACDAHRDSLSGFLTARGFLREVTPLSPATGPGGRYDRPMATSVAVLGTGIMGAPMARNLARAGFEVRAWNRSREKSAPLAQDGIAVADDPAGAARGADVVLTMLADGPTTAEVIAAAAPAAGTVWLQMGTIGVDWTRRLADSTDLVLVDAPVAGSDGPARDGQLVVLASGPDEVRDRVAPLFDVVGRKTLWLGPVGGGSALKLAINNWAIVQVEGIAESLALTAALGVDPAQLVDALADLPLGSPFAVLKGRAMLAGTLDPGFPLKLAVKDAGLAVDAATGAGVELPLTGTLRPLWQGVVQEGYGDEDIAAAGRRYDIKPH